MIPAGFSDVEVPGFAPAPRSQKYDQLPPVLPVLVKSTPAPAQTGAVVVKLAVGVRLMLIV